MSQTVRLLILAAVTLAVCGIAPSNVSATQMHCGDPQGYCWWGYNIVSPSVNPHVYGTWNNFTDSFIDKVSGGWIVHGWNDTSGGCFEYSNYNGYSTYTPADTGDGCDSYVQRWLDYWSGTQSYLKFDACAPQSGLCSAGPAANEQSKLPPVANNSSRGRPVSILPHDLWTLQELAAHGASLGEVSFIRSEARRAYYRIPNSNGADCYAVGPMFSPEYLFGQVACAAGFPSAAQPVLDFTLMHQTAHDPTSVRVIRSEGFAIDDVASVEVQAASGAVVARAPVVDNVYSVQSLPDVQVTKIVARDRAGSVVWFLPVSFVPSI
jgi:hypothetical protein